MLIRHLISAWDNYPVTSGSSGNHVPVSIIIPARNEAKNILSTLNAVTSQNYTGSLIEIILIDDHSEDETKNLVQDNFPDVIIYQNKDHEIGKKQSLSTGIQLAKHQIIITLDADVLPLSENWLSILSSSLTASQSLALTGPVIYNSNNSIWQDYQALENLGMMLSTAAGYSTNWFQLSNGANLIFYKNTFLELGGFEGNEPYASGDDMFLFEKIESKYPGKTGFIKNADASVITEPVLSVKEYINQRIRWGTKNKVLKNSTLKLVLGYVFLFNLLLIISIYLIPFNGFPLIIGVILSWIIKANSDHYMLSKSWEFFKTPNVKRSFWISVLIYPALLSTTGLFSLFTKSYIWKGRKME